MKVTEATGVLFLEHNTVIICGGRKLLGTYRGRVEIKECFVLTNEGFEFLVNMTEPRTSAQSIVLHDEKMLIIGGENEKNDTIKKLQSMEILSLTDFKSTKQSSIRIPKPLANAAIGKKHALKNMTSSL